MTEAEQNRAIRDNMHLVDVIASEYRGGEVEFEELKAEGALGLSLAGRTFDASRGAQFPTWATTRIRAAIIDRIRRDNVTHDITSSDHIERIFDWNAWGKMGNAMAISEAWVSLECSPEDLAERFDALKDMRDRFDAAFISLTGNQRKLIKWVYLDKPAMSIPDAARELGLSYYRTARMLKKALATMRAVIVAMETKASGGSRPSRALGTIAA